MSPVASEYHAVLDIHASMVGPGPLPVLPNQSKLEKHFKLVKGGLNRMRKYILPDGG